MTWARLDDRANGHAKLQALSDPGFRMWASGLVYCQANLTDGFIPEHAIPSFGVRARNKRAVVEELCQSLVPGKGPLWHRVEGGFQVHDYLNWNDARAVILEEREKARVRMDRLRTGRRTNGERSPEQTPNRPPNRTPNVPPSVRVSTYHNHGFLRNPRDPRIRAVLVRLSVF